MQAEAEIWFRNCFLYVNELIEENEYNVVLDIGYTVKRKLDPIKWMELKFGNSFPWRLILVGELDQGAKEYRSGSSKPYVSHPVWSAKLEDVDALYELVNTGEHEYVVAVDFPNMVFASSKYLLRQVSDLQEQYPKTKILIHGLYSISKLLGNSFLAVDFNPRDDAAHGTVYFPSGKFYKIENIGPEEMPNLALCGMTKKDIEVPRNRCLFNIRSIRRASYSFKEEKRYSTKAKDFYNLDIYSSDTQFRQVTNNRIFLRNNLKILGGDKFHCDTCTLALDCKLYRKGAVCAVPGTEVANLSKYFATRNSEVIVEGLGKLMQMQAERIEQDIRTEEIEGAKDKDINKDLKSLFDQGTKLAKLIDPNLRGTSQTNVQVNVDSGKLNGQPSAKVLITEAIKELELRGIPRDRITPGMIQGLFEGMVDPENSRRAIEGTVIAGEVDL